MVSYPDTSCTTVYDPFRSKILFGSRGPCLYNLVANCNCNTACSSKVFNLAVTFAEPNEGSLKSKIMFCILVVKLAYPNLLGKKSYVVVVVVGLWNEDISSAD